jgi:hypothetical protein
MNKDILRLLELSGQRDKSEIVKKLYEGYKVNPMADEEGMDPIKGLEGPFRMKNGRVVYYDPKEGKYYDRRTDMYLSNAEAAALHEDGTQFNEGVILHATGENKSISLRLEAMMEMRPMASVLRTNGYDGFEVTDTNGKRSPMDFDSGDHNPDGEMAQKQLDNMRDNVSRLCDVVTAETDLPAWVSSKITMAADYLDTVADYLAAKDDDLGKTAGDMEDDMAAAKTMESVASDGKNMVELDEASKEGTIRIIDLGNTKQDPSRKDSYRKELGIGGLPEKGFQVQVMTNGKFANVGKPHKDLKSAEEFKRTGQHSMQFEGVVTERALASDEKAKLDALKKKHEGSAMYKSMIDQYGKEKGEEVFYAKLTKMAKEGLDEGKGRPRDLKHTGGLSDAINKSEKKALKAKERQQGKEETKVTETTASSAELVSMAADKVKSKLVGDKEADPKAGIRREPTKPNATKRVVDSSADVTTDKDGIMSKMSDPLKGSRTGKKIMMYSSDGKVWDSSRENVVAMKKEVVEAARAIIEGDDKADYTKWRTDVLKKHGSKKVSFFGDKEELAGASVDVDGKKKSVGAWDGTKGVVYEAAKSDDSNEPKFAKGDHVMYKNMKKVVVVADGPADMTGISDKADGKVDMVKTSELKKSEKVEEAMMVSPANLFVNSDLPAHAVDDAELKGERTGQKDRTSVKNKVPTEVMKAIKKRVDELKKSIERYDDKGYNDLSVKSNAIEALEQIRDNLSRGDHEGFMEAQMFFLTLMSPIWDMIPAQVVNYLAKGSDE